MIWKKWRRMHIGKPDFYLKRVTLGQHCLIELCFGQTESAAAQYGSYWSHVVIKH